MITAEREVVLYLPAQHHLCVLQRIVVQQPVKFSSLCRGIAFFVLNGDTVDGKCGAIFKSGLLPVGVHVIVAGKHFLRVIMIEILISFHLNSSFNDFEI